MLVSPLHIGQIAAGEAGSGADDGSPCVLLQWRESSLVEPKTAAWSIEGARKVALALLLAAQEAQEVAQRARGALIRGGLE